MAYARLGTSFSNMGGNAEGPMKKAYELRERVSEREKFYIDAHYFRYVAQNLEAARQTCELWAQIYPRDVAAHSNLETIYAELGDHNKALAAGQRALTLEPSSGLEYANVVDDYLLLFRPEEAKAKALEAQARGLDSPRLHWLLYNVAFQQRDAVGMEQEVAALMGKPGWESSILLRESHTAAYAGHFDKARELTRRAIDSAQRDRNRGRAAGYQAQGALREALAGNMGTAKQQAQAALALSQGGNTAAVSASAVALGLAGDSAEAIRLADDLAKRFPQDRVLQSRNLPRVYAAAALGKGKGAEAAEALSKDVNSGPDYEQDYLRGEAYLMLGRGGRRSRRISENSGSSR